MERELDVGALPLGMSVFAERRGPVDASVLQRVESERASLVEATEADEFSCSFTKEREYASIREELIRAIGLAQRRVFITSFRIGDRKLNRALIAAAERLRGGVYVITSLDDEALRRGGDRIASTVERLDESRREIGDDEEVQEKYFGPLSKRGVFIRGLRACHAKFAVIDDQLAIVSTANFETRGFDVTQECAVTLRNAAHVEALRSLFARLWFQCAMEASLEQDAYTMQNRKAAAWPGSVPTPSAETVGPIWTCGEKETFILDAARDIIDGARHHLLLASFGLHDNHARPELILDPLTRAIERGVQVDLLLRSRNNVPGHRRDAEIFLRRGVRVRADALNHAKAVIGDGVRGAIFSANLDIRHGLVDDVEVGVRLDGTPALGEIAAFLARAYDVAPFTFHERPTHAQASSAVRSADSRHGHWPFDQDLFIVGTADDFEQLLRQSSSGPVLYGANKDGPCKLFVGGMSWYLAQERGKKIARLSGGQREKQTSLELLEEWLSNPPSKPCGICTARLTWVGVANTANTADPPDRSGGR